MIEVVHHERRPGEGHFSIERLFETVRAALPNPFTARRVIAPFESRGLVRRVANARHARAHAGTVNHVVGDVHYLALGLPERGLVLTIHDCAAMGRLQGAAREAFRQGWLVQPMQHAAVITTISKTMQDELRAWVGPLAHRVRVIPNCVRGEYRPAKPPQNTRPVVLQIGAGWNKNVERVAQALAGLGVTLRVVGALSAAQKRLLASLDLHVEALGRLDDGAVHAAYLDADIVAFASLYEGFGLPILEAQAVGRPVVTSARGAMIEAAGRGALLVDPESIDSVREGFTTLLSSPSTARRLVDSGFDNVAKYQPDRVAALYARAYEDSLAP